jgi:hypothetical protein
MAVKLLDQVREAIRARHYSRRTEEACVSQCGASSCFMVYTHVVNQEGAACAARSTRSA